MPRPVSKTQETIYCNCGCGETLLKYDVKWRPRSNIHGHHTRGKKQTDDHIRKRADQMQGSSHPGWKGGRFIRDKTRPYVWVWNPEHPHCDSKGYVPEHRLVMEGKLGRMLTPEEVVHHINEDTTDNHDANLRVYPSQGEHMRDYFDNR